MMRTKVVILSTLCVNLIILGVELAANIEIDLLPRLLIVVPTSVLISTVICEGWVPKE